MMITPAKPLTADEIARIKRYVSGHRGLATPLAAEEGQSLIATIEQQAEQIKIANAAYENAINATWNNNARGPNICKIRALATEILAATEPKP